jgi:hypothetical protein
MGVLKSIERGLYVCVRVRMLVLYVCVRVCMFVSVGRDIAERTAFSAFLVGVIFVRTGGLLLALDLAALGSEEELGGELPLRVPGGEEMTVFSGLEEALASGGHGDELPMLVSDTGEGALPAIEGRALEGVKKSC